MRLEAETRPTGALGLTVIRGSGQVEHLGQQLPPSRWPTWELRLAEIVAHGMPQRGLPAEVNRWRRANRANLARGLRRVMAARALGLPHFYGQLYLTVFRGDGKRVDLGLASLRVVTDVGVKFIVDDFNANAQDVTTMKFHGFGTGGTAEAATQTALVTEETTGYNPDNTRPTGSQASAGTTGSATYTTVGTFSPDGGASPRPITEHGIFSASSAGTLLDRSLFSVVNLVINADSLQATYVLTVNSGG